MAVGRRATGGVPHISALDWIEGRVTLENWLKHLLDGYSGLPAAHETTHLAGGSDALQTPGLPSSILLGDSAAIGGGPSYAREDHDHETVSLLAQIRNIVSLRI